MDREGHVVNKTAGRGKISATAIDKAIGQQIDGHSILCTDAAANYKTFAFSKHLEYKTLNDSRKQYVVGKNYHIQHVNSYHTIVKCYKPEGTYFLWMDFREYGLTAAEIRKKSYSDANVVLENGEMFDPDTRAGFERICVPNSRSVLEEVFNRIAAEFKGL
jgi:bifunctional pyridoxal-dependent enzyme with beta-cystathionase and maltose regulon repressor activities